MLLVRPQQSGQVEVREGVPVERQEALLELLFGELDRAGGSARLGLRDVANTRAAGLAVAEHLSQGMRHEAAGEQDLLHPVRAEPLDHVGDEGPVDQAAAPASGSTR